MNNSTSKLCQEIARLKTIARDRWDEIVANAAGRERTAEEQAELDMLEGALWGSTDSGKFYRESAAIIRDAAKYLNKKRSECP